MSLSKSFCFDFFAFVDLICFFFLSFHNSALHFAAGKLFFSPYGWCVGCCSWQHQNQLETYHGHVGAPDLLIIQMIEKKWEEKNTSMILIETSFRNSFKSFVPIFFPVLSACTVVRSDNQGSFLLLCTIKWLWRYRIGIGVSNL